VTTRCHCRDQLLALAGFVFGMAGGVLLAAGLVMVIGWRGNSVD
jgi:hypothetical protein